MQIDLNFNTTQMGVIGSANLLGYLFGLFFINKLYAKFGPALLIKSSLIMQSFCMILMATNSNFPLISLLFCITGFFGAMSFMSIMTYITQIVPKEIKGKATGIAIMGIGSSIIFSGIVISMFDNFLDSSFWKAGWLSFALAIFIISFLLKKGLSFPLYIAKKSSSLNYSRKDIFGNIRLLQISFIYFLFGVTYVIYITFFIAALEAQWQINSEISSLFWTFLGFSSLFSGFIFGAIADKIGCYKSLIFIFLIQILAHSILSFHSPIALVWFSAFLFGISAWAVPSIMAVISSELFDGAYTIKILSFVTIFFAVGQTIGPVGAGYLIDISSNFYYAFLVSTILVFIGLILAFWVDYKHKNSIMRL